MIIGRRIRVARDSAGRGFVSPLAAGARAQATHLGFLFGNTAIDEGALNRGQLRLEQRLVAGDVLSVSLSSNGNFVGHNHNPLD
jgi:hypothetical protein